MLPSKAYAVTLATQEATNHFGDNKKGKMAGEAVGIGMDYLHSMPIGWNINDSQLDFERKLRRHIEANYKPKPSGFLPAIGLTWLFWTLVSSIISWAVRRIMDWKFPRTPDKPF